MRGAAIKEPIPLRSGAIGTGFRVGSLVRFRGKERFVLEIRTHTVETPTINCNPPALQRPPATIGIPPQTLFGDVNEDGAVDATDLEILEGIVAGSVPEPDLLSQAGINADINGDGRIDQTDVDLLASKLNSEIDKFPLEIAASCPRIPIKLTVTQVKIAEGFVPITEVTLIRI